jgi:RNA polymerase sigma-70 factor, ECF subfamily
MPLRPTDTELVTAACQGDLASFGKLYDRYYRMAVGIACSRLADIHIAEDAAQEAFAVACSTLTTLQEKHRFPQWLGTICRRKASQMAADRPTAESLSKNCEPSNDSDLAALRQQVRDSL